MKCDIHGQIGSRPFAPEYLFELFTLFLLAVRAELVHLVYWVVQTNFFVIAEVVVSSAVGSHDDGNAAIPGHERNPERTRVLRKLRWCYVLCPEGIVVFEND